MGRIIKTCHIRRLVLAEVNRIVHIRDPEGLYRAALRILSIRKVRRNLCGADLTRG
jgi:hypothetical protein